MGIHVKGRTRRQTELRERVERHTAAAEIDPSAEPHPPALVRVILSYEDGSAIRLEGRDAQRWEAAVNQQIVLGSIHGVPFPEFPWKKLFGGPPDGKAK